MDKGIEAAYRRALADASTSPELRRRVQFRLALGFVYEWAFKLGTAALIAQVLWVLYHL